MDERTKDKILWPLVVGLGLSIVGLGGHLALNPRKTIVHSNSEQVIRQPPRLQVHVPEKNSTPERRNWFALDEGLHRQLQENQPVSSLNRILTQRDTDLLSSFTINGTRANQYLNFENSALTPLYGEDEMDETGYFLFGEDRTGRETFRYEIEFENGLQSRREQGKLVDIIGQELMIIGQPYTIANATIDDNGYGCIVLEMQYAQIECADNIFNNTFSPNHSVPRGWDPESPLGIRVNNEQTKERVKISASINEGSAEINSLTISVSCDTLLGDLYLPVGRQLGAYLDAPYIMLSPKWNIEYHGRRDNGSHEVRFVDLR